MANSVSESQSNQVSHHPVKARNRRLFFRALAKLDDWLVPPQQSLPIAARAAGCPAINSHALALQAQLQQGKTLSQAFEFDQAFWGERTVRLLRQLGESKAGAAFQRLAGGAAEHPLQRTSVSCFGMGWRRRLLSVAVLVAVAGFFLPILIHVRSGDGLPLIVVPSPRFPYVASNNNHYELLGTGWLSGPLPQWKRYWQVVNYNDITLHAAGDLRPLAKNLALQRNTPGITGDLARYFQKLNEVIGDPQTVACYLETRKRLYPMAAQVELLVSLDQLVVSPVPAVWLQRAQRVSVARDELQPQPGDARASLRDLHKSCPFLNQLITIPNTTTSS
jgi:hypothetical protein